MGDVSGPRAPDADGVLWLSGTASVAADGYKGRQDVKAVVVGAAVLSIGEGAFSGCEALVSLTFAGAAASPALPGVTVTGAGTASPHAQALTIGDQAFFRCSALKSVVLPGRLRHVGAWGFAGCTSMATVAFPDGDGCACSLGDSSFFDCTALTELCVPPITPTRSSARVLVHRCTPPHAHTHMPPSPPLPTTIVTPPRPAGRAPINVGAPSARARPGATEKAQTRCNRARPRAC